MYRFARVAQLVERSDQIGQVRTQMKGYLYIIQSQTNRRYYIGSTNDWKRRINEHNGGLSTYTRTTRPWVIKYKKEFNTITEARKEEVRLKKMKSRKILEELIAGRLAQR